MSYTKTQWVNNTTPINDTNLNKIEQGIYDNSLVVDAVTNTINPTDTETYKTAELTEGQITDVIGVSDIVIKGQTSQDGTPTPSAPVDVNVVSGSNVINTSNKNLINISDFVTTNVGITITKVGEKWVINGTATADNTFRFESNSIMNLNGQYVVSVKYGSGTKSGNANFNIRNKSTNNNIFSTNLTTSNTSNTATLNVAISFGIYIASGATFNNYTFYPMLETGSTVTTYEPHQGKELPLDLPVENLFDGELELGTITNGTGATGASNNAIRSVNYIEVKPNTTYTLSNDKNYTPYVFEYNSSKTYISNSTTQVTPYTFTTTSTTKYIKFRTIEGKVENDLTTKFMLELGSKANAYTPYSTDPIELCKTGNYQDYFYRDNSKGKWYLHKEITFETRTSEDNWQTDTIPSANPRKFVRNNNHIYIVPANNDTIVTAVCNYPLVSATNTATGTPSGVAIHPNGSFYISADVYNNLTSAPIKIYIPLITPTDTEITDTTLISQLEAIYNAPLYEQTNITQENNDLPMILDITACKDNINGIKAFIRK